MDRSPPVMREEEARWAILVTAVAAVLSVLAFAFTVAQF
jgi:hypothetical protein